MTGALSVATLAGGCFWCTEAVFQRLRGVSDVVSGYTGGDVPDPTYEAVCSGRTGHAEGIQFRFDPQVIDYRTLLEVFFATHDPTTLNRQGNDVGTQYRSAIYVHDAGQRQVAEDLVRELNAGPYRGRIVTEITDAGVFYPAEQYHQNYYNDNRMAPYCQVIIDPKVAKLLSVHGDLAQS